MIYKTDASPELCYLTVTKEKVSPRLLDRNTVVRWDIVTMGGACWDTSLLSLCGSHWRGLLWAQRV